MPTRERFETVDAALAESRSAFAVRHRVVGIAARERCVIIRVARLDLFVGKTFEDPEAALAQIPIRDDIVPGRVRDAPCGLMCAPEVTRVKRRKRNLFQAPRELPRLLQAERGERAVVLPL